MSSVASAVHTLAVASAVRMADHMAFAEQEPEHTLEVQPDHTAIAVVHILGADMIAEEAVHILAVRSVHILVGLVAAEECREQSTILGSCGSMSRCIRDRSQTPQP